MNIFFQKARKPKYRKFNGLNWALVVLILGACTPVRGETIMPASTGTILPMSAPLPLSDAVDLGILGKGKAEDIAWSPDGKLLAVAGSNGVYLYNTRTWELEITILPHVYDDLKIDSLSFYPDGKNLLLISTSRVSVFNYEIESGQAVRLFKLVSFNPVAIPFFAPDGKTFAFLTSSCNENGVIRCRHGLNIRETSNGNVLHELLGNLPEEEKAIYTAAFSPDSKTLAAGTGENLIYGWEASTGQLLYKLQHDGNVYGVTFSPDGKMLISASADATIRFWDARTGKNLHTLRGFNSGAQHVAYINGALLVGFSDGSFKQWTVNEKFLPEDKPYSVFQADKQGFYARYPTASNRMQISPSGNMMAVIANANVEIWDLRAGKSVITLPEFTNDINVLAFSPDSRLLAIGDHNLHFWDTRQKTLLATLDINPDGALIKAVAFHPDGNQVAVPSSTGNIQIWDLPAREKSEEIETVGDLCTPDRLAYSPNGLQLAVASWCGVRIVDLETNQLKWEVKFNKDGAVTGNPLEMAFNSSGKSLILAGENGLWEWDLTTGKEILTVNGFKNRVWRALINVHQQMAVLEMYDSGELKFLDLNSGQDAYNFQGRWYSEIATDSDGRLLATEDYDSIKLLDFTSGQELFRIGTSPDLLALSLDGKFLAAAHSYPSVVQLWDVSTTKRLAGLVPPLTATSFPTITPTQTNIPSISSNLSVTPMVVPTLPSNSISAQNVGHLVEINRLGLGSVSTAAWSPDGEIFALGGTPGIYLYELEGNSPFMFLPADEFLLRLLFSPNGKYLVAQSPSSIQVWEATTGKSLHVLESKNCSDTDLSFQTNEKLLLRCSNGVEDTWNIASGELIESAITKDVGVYSPDGKLASYIYWNSIVLQNPATGVIIKTFELPGSSPSIAMFSPDGKYLFAWFYEFSTYALGLEVFGVSGKSTMQIWKLQRDDPPTLHHTLSTGEWNNYLSMHEVHNGASLSNDGTRLATASGDNTIRLWDVASGQLLRTLKTECARVYFSPDGTRLLSVGDDSRLIQVWNVTPGFAPKVVKKIGGFGSNVVDIQFALDGNTLFSTSGRVVQVWELNNFNSEPEISVPLTDYAYSFAFSDTGNYFASGGSKELILGRRTSKGFDTRSVRSFEYSNTSIHAVTFSPNGKLLASSDPDYTIRILDLISNTVLEIRADDYITGLSFSPDGQILAGYSTDKTKFWDVQTGKILAATHSLGDRFIYHPDGTMLAFGDEEGRIFLLDITENKIVQEMKMSSAVLGLTFSPDGKMLATTSRESIEFWDIPTGLQISAISEGANCIVFSSDGKRFAACEGQSIIVRETP